MKNFDVEIKLKNGWKGVVTVEVPPHPIRQLNGAKCNAHKLLDKKTLDGPDGDEKFYEVNLPIIAAAWEFARPLIRGVAIANEKTKEAVNTLEELETHDALSNAWMVVAIQYLQGYGPGKTKSPS